MRISDWSSDVCSSDLTSPARSTCRRHRGAARRRSACNPLSRPQTGRIQQPSPPAMPIYAYRCAACEHDFDRLQKLSDPDPDACPSCGAAGQVRRQVTAPSFRLAGSGWYEPDFKKDGDKKRNLVEGTESAAAKPEVAKADAKPATDAKHATKPAHTAQPAPAKPPPASRAQLTCPASRANIRGFPAPHGRFPPEPPSDP